MIIENFANLLNIAKQEVVKEKTEKDFQVVVIEYSNGKIENFLLPYPDFFAGDKIISAVRTNDVHEIKRIVCMWHNCGLDLPCYDLRCSLYSLSEKNGFTEILLQGENSFIVKELKSTLK